MEALAEGAVVAVDMRSGMERAEVKEEEVGGGNEACSSRGARRRASDSAMGGRGGRKTPNANGKVEVGAKDSDADE